MIGLSGNIVVTNQPAQLGKRSVMVQTEYDSVVADLLGEGPTEIVTNPDEGVYDNRPFQGATLVRNNSGTFAAVLAFGLDDDNPLRVHRERINLPEVDSHPVSKNLTLRWFHALGVVPRGVKECPLVGGEDDDARAQRAERIVAAIDSRKGRTVSFSLKEDNNGFLRAQPRITKGE